MTDETIEPRPLVGLTITAVDPGVLDERFDDECIHLTTSDGRRWLVCGGYGGFTGNSQDEYIELVSITEVPVTPPS